MAEHDTTIAEADTGDIAAPQQTPGSESTSSAVLQKRHPMEALLKAGGVVVPKPGEVAEGSVVEKKGGVLFVDLGIKGMGIVYGREYKAAEDIIKPLEPGDAVNAKIVELDNDEGYIELSLKEAGDEKLDKAVDAIEKKYAEEAEEKKVEEKEFVPKFAPKEDEDAAWVAV